MPKNDLNVTLKGMFSDQIDDEDMDFMRHEFVTYSMASDYYGLGLKPVTQMAHECGAIYKIGRKILIRRSIFEEYAEKEHRTSDLGWCWYR